MRIKDAYNIRILYASLNSGKSNKRVIGKKVLSSMLKHAKYNSEYTESYGTLGYIHIRKTTYTT